MHTVVMTVLTISTVFLEKNGNYQFKSDWFRNLHLMDTCKKRRMYLNRGDYYTYYITAKLKCPPFIF